MIDLCALAILIVGETVHSILILTIVAGLLWGLSRKPEKLKTNMKEA